MIERVREKERRRERLGSMKDDLAARWREMRRSLHWIFPEYRYMCAIYPWLESLPILLPVSWIIRDVRLLLGMLKNKLRSRKKARVSDQGNQDQADF